jgi:hypothetical protein
MTIGRATLELKIPLKSPKQGAFYYLSHERKLSNTSCFNCSRRLRSFIKLPGIFAEVTRTVQVPLVTAIPRWIVLGEEPSHRLEGRVPAADDFSTAAHNHGAIMPPFS